MRGKGFRDLLFNIALLGRQVWRLIHFKDTFLVPSTFLMEIVSGLRGWTNPRLWSSIAQAAKALENGFVWLIGDGKRIDIQHDKWGFQGLSGDSINHALLTESEKVIKDIWHQDNMERNQERVCELFGKKVGDQICDLPISKGAFEDRLTWIHNLYGCYTSKLAYSWLILKRVGFGPHRVFLHVIWKLKMLPKIKVFNWRVGHEILPTYNKIELIRQDFVRKGPRCDADEETLIHVLKDCPSTREILTHGRLDNRLINGNYMRCID
ncbi:hypothetical protein PVK06_005679 [Gossypium arboreum]|uniref:Reverse transcriptase zinc-binding domain-containing protein n=1 Tax=Gossypium arboreum TaxID=29729 RepID=A0ABR0QVE7_GOSAR|nr:hypothetical protein PVK06_005679 [Gossypium arboreum]